VVHNLWLTGFNNFFTVFKALVGDLGLEENISKKPPAYLQPRALQEVFGETSPKPSPFLEIRVLQWEIP
jgi:hypothetical protein